MFQQRWECLYMLYNNSKFCAITEALTTNLYEEYKWDDANISPPTLYFLLDNLGEELLDNSGEEFLTP